MLVQVSPPCYCVTLPLNTPSSLEASYCEHLTFLRGVGGYLHFLEAECLYKVFVVFCRGDLYISQLFYLIIYLYQYRHTDIYFTLDCNPILLYFIPQIVSLLAIRSSFISLLCPFDTPHHCGFFLSFFRALNFLIPHKGQAKSCLFSIPVLESDIFPKTLVPF